MRKVVVLYTECDAILFEFFLYMVKMWKGEMVESLHESPPGYTPRHPCLPGSSTDRQRSVDVIKPVPSEVVFIRVPLFHKIKHDIFSKYIDFCYVTSVSLWGWFFYPFPTHSGDTLKKFSWRKGTGAAPEQTNAEEREYGTWLCCQWQSTFARINSG